MNIMLIDDGLGLPAGSALSSPAEETLRRLLAENLRRHIALAKAFFALGDNVLLVRAAPSPEEKAELFEYREADGIAQLFVHTERSRRGFHLPWREIYDFVTLLRENASGVAGIFKPYVVISASFFPFTVYPAEKIARLSGAVLITELPCSAKQLSRRLKLSSPVDLAAPVLSHALSRAQKASTALIALYPDAHADFPGQKNLLELLAPALDAPKKPSDEAKMLKDELCSLREDGAFVLAYGGELQKGYSLEALIAAASGFSGKLCVVMLGTGGYKTVLRRIAREAGANVLFFDGVSPAEMPFVLSAADCVFVAENTYIGGLAPESEAFCAALLSGRPVLAAADKTASFFKKSGGAVTTFPANPEGISLGIKTLRDMPQTERETLGLCGVKFSGQHSPDCFAKDYHTIIENLYNNKET